MSVLPPFEGWDEYQHLAYIAYVVEKGEAPVLHESRVPRSMYPALVRYPHSSLAVQQHRAIGTRSYAEYWDAPANAVAPDAPDIHLYQAQHPSLYYRLVAPLFRWTWNSDDPLPAITVLRGVNVLFGAAAMLTALTALGRILKPGPHRYVIGLLIALQPLFLLNVARVASDALAVFLGTAVISIVLCSGGRRVVVVAAVTGAILGLAVLAKTVNLALLPFVLLWPVVLVRRDRVSRLRAASAALLLIIVFAAITARYFHGNLTRFGVLTPMQEAVANKQAGKSWIDLAAAAGRVDWFDEFNRRLTRRIVWSGGWSFLEAPEVIKGWHQALVWTAAAGWVFALRRTVRGRAWVFSPGWTCAHMALVPIGMVAGMAYHLLHGLVAIGAVYTNAWYAAVSFPWLLCIFYQGAACLPTRWPGRLTVLSMIVVYLTAEGYGVFGIMVPSYTGHGWGPIARQRLAQIHPPGLGSEWTLLAAVVALGLVVVAVAVWLRRERVTS